MHTDMKSATSLSAIYLAAAMGCAGHPPPDSGPPAAGPVVLQPGDALRVAFSAEPGLNGEFRIDEDGTVVLPLLGERRVTSVPADSVKRKIIAEYDGVVRNQSVQVVNLMRVRILGAVASPGLYYVDPTMTLADAVALAGGASTEGKLGDVRLVRAGREFRTSLDVSSLELFEIRSGDQIIVSHRSWFARNSSVLIGSMIASLGVVIAATR